MKIDVVANYYYKDRKLFIFLMDKSKIIFASLDENNKFGVDISKEEYEVSKLVLNSITPDLEKSIYIGDKTVNNGTYKIFVDRRKRLYYWELKNGFSNENDNVFLNYRFNHFIDTVFDEQNFESPYIDEKSKQRRKKIEFFQRYLKIGKKLINISISTGIVATMLTGCTIYDSNRNDSENIITSQSGVEVENSTNNTENVHTSEFESEYTIENNTVDEAEMYEYHFQDIEKALEENKFLTKDEKDFFLKLKFMFDDYHEYMNVPLIIERLKSLQIQYEKFNPWSDLGGKYNYQENKITYYGDGFSDIDISSKLHEILHVFQDNHYYNYYTLELSNEFFTREMLKRMYSEGILDKKEFLSKYWRMDYEEGLIDIETEEDWLYYVSIGNGFGSGYGSNIPIYYVFNSLMTPEDILKYQFSPDDIEIIEDCLIKIDDNEKLDVATTRAVKLLENINNLREYDSENKRFVLKSDYDLDMLIFDDLDYYYEKSNGKRLGSCLDFKIINTINSFKGNMIWMNTDDTQSVNFFYNFLKDELGIDISYSWCEAIIPTYLSSAQPDMLLIFDPDHTKQDIKETLVVTDEIREKYEQQYYDVRGITLSENEDELDK